MKNVEMKKMKSASCKVFIFSVFLLLILAQTSLAEQEKTKNRVIAPDSVIWYFKMALERVQIILVLNPEEKALTGIQIASNRVAEANQLISEKKYNYINKSLQDYTSVISKVEDALEKIRKDEPKEEFKAQLSIEIKIEELEKNIDSLQEERIRKSYEEKISGLRESIENKKADSASKIISLENKTEGDVEALESELRYELEIKKINSGNASELYKLAGRRISEIKKLSGTGCFAESDIEIINDDFVRAGYYLAMNESAVNESLSRELLKNVIRKSLHPRFKCRCEEPLVEQEIISSEVQQDQNISTLTTGKASLTIVKQKKCKPKKMKG